MNRFAASVILLALAAGGCSRTEPGTPPTAPAATPAANAPATAANEVQAPAPKPEDPNSTFDKRTFAGTFTGDGLSLRLGGDGSYQLQAPGTEASTGTWTHEAGSIRLDPDSKSASDRLFRIDGPDRVVEAGGQATLRRQASP